MTKHFETPVIFSLPHQAASDFCEHYLTKSGIMISLADLRDKELAADLADQAAHVFANLLKDLQYQLDCPEIGIVAVDIPSILDDATLDAIAGALLAVSLTQALMPTLTDGRNQTPFSVFTTSADSLERLERAGLQDLTPTNRLEFHSDSALTGTEVAVPDYISVYNIAINFEERGYFHWVPTCKLDGLAALVDRIGLSDAYYFKLNPTVYEDGQNDVMVIEHRVKATIFSHDQNGSITTYMSGQFDGKVGEEHTQSHDVVTDMVNAISENKFRYSIPQESRRLLIMNNANGFHARDALEKPLPGVAVNRVYLRCTSVAGKVVGEIVGE
ncbi:MULTISPECIES: hypothetical protein [Brucella/Ochrobactrum group]|uniref:TauD/TfdA-like domain-containing protein n=1 Tax=Ochrobactrum soli TaxID=2448455 RepID=A0A2P9HFW5_9HYPH|nr:MULTISPECIES: hypothetical protein [Brucella]MCI1002126.1 hypothetical protein [Ochrobactrum sp. C6C9]RRD22768.1 hypothetical protein ECB98_19365 [Brucellaceae bacterium VT-16-1752]WHT43388.1 hypothetical protein QLQ11_15905 [Ochrobactrum sp. SSR]MDX4076040.1 hypothetical protein [Brucella sp. NBRC 113783]NNU59832.1 hypothetical protein [[Ochrobactrum] soli]